jgi:hypothetical protein
LEMEGPATHEGEGGLCMNFAPWIYCGARYHNDCEAEYLRVFVVEGFSMGPATTSCVWVFGLRCDIFLSW